MQPCYSAQVPRVRVQVLGHKRVQLQRSVTPSELTLSDFVAFGSSIGINVGFFAGITPPKALTRIKVEGQEASKQLKEGGDTHEPKSTTTTTTTTVPKPHKF